MPKTDHTTTQDPTPSELHMLPGPLMPQPHLPAVDPSSLRARLCS